MGSSSITKLVENAEVLLFQYFTEMNTRLLYLVWLSAPNKEYLREGSDGALVSN